MRRELGPEGRIGDFLDNLDRARRTLEKLPDATDNIAALAKAWVDGDVDLSRRPDDRASATQPSLTKGFAWAGLGAVVSLGGVWAASQFL